MRHMRRVAACALIPVLMTGCAGMGEMAGRDMERETCIVSGAVAGAAAGIALDGEVLGALVGLAGGTVLGQILCQESDSDGDGVTEAHDQCPGTPEAAHGAVDDKGCPLQSDADGVPDYLDRCPDTEAGVEVDEHGCPIDSDGDGFSDAIDACPTEPAPDSEDGCPVPCEPIAIITNVNFDFDSARIRSDAEAKLGGVLEVLTAKPEVLVRVVGHADSTGPEGYNMGLSVRRAEAVREYLAGRGVAMESMDASGKGESEPLVSNKTRAGRSVNRRVEFMVQNEVCM